jgi:hypothetical protein
LLPPTHQTGDFPTEKYKWGQMKALQVTPLVWMGQQPCSRSFAKKRKLKIRISKEKRFWRLSVLQKNEN